MEKETFYPVAKIRKVSFRMSKPNFQEFENAAKEKNLNKSDFLRTIIKNNLPNGRNNQHQEKG